MRIPFQEPHVSWLLIRHVRLQITLKEFAVAWHKEMNKLVDDGVLAQVSWDRKQLGIECKATARRERCPLALHDADMHTRRLDGCSCVLPNANSLLRRYKHLASRVVNGFTRTDP